MKVYHQKISIIKNASPRAGNVTSVHLLRGIPELLLLRERTDEDEVADDVVHGVSFMMLTLIKACDTVPQKHRTNRRE